VKGRVLLRGRPQNQEAVNKVFDASLEFEPHFLL
jgi:hypothetical protein